jgi:GTP-binding protein EngB required for normal cell division
MASSKDQPATAVSSTGRSIANPSANTAHRTIDGASDAPTKVAIKVASGLAINQAVDGTIKKTPDGATRLLHLAALGEEFGAKSLAEEARDLAARVSEGRFYVACVGQFKRGKSTLINALVGQPVLPTGYLPVTAVPTVVRFGERQYARIRKHDGAWNEIPLSHLKQYVTEELNPENKKGIQGVEVFVPSPLLSSGMCFVDTPGLGSVFAGNSAATQALVPHIDAAVVVVGADPPLAGEELSLAEAVGKQVRELILVLGKADRTTDAERAAAAHFTRELLQKRLQRVIGPVFEISAQERAENRGPERDWKRLLEALQSLFNGSGCQFARSACDRGLQRLGEQLLIVISDAREALERPIEESETRIALMKQTMADAQRSMRELGYLFMAEQQHISDMFVGRHQAFLSRIRPQADREFDASLQSASGWFGPSYRRRTFQQAQDVARRHVVPWLKPEQEDAEKQYRRVALRFVEMANDFLKKLADAGISELARMPHALDPEHGFRVRSEFAFHAFIDVAHPASPLRWLADLMLGLAGAKWIIRNEAREFLIRLLETNSARVQSDVLNRVQESRGKLEAEIRKLLHEVSRIAEQALARTKKLREDGEPAVQAQLRRLQTIEREVTALSLDHLNAARRCEPESESIARA